MNRPGTALCLAVTTTWGQISGVGTAAIESYALGQFLKEVSQKSLVFEFRSFIFEGSLAEKLRLRVSKLHF